MPRRYDVKSVGAGIAHRAQRTFKTAGPPHLHGLQLDIESWGGPLGFWQFIIGMLGFHRNAVRCTRGTTSLRSSNRFEAVSSSKSVTPVALRAGRARLAASPSWTGSALLMKTIGVVEVAFAA